MYQAFSKKGTLFKGGHYLRKYGMYIYKIDEMIRLNFNERLV